MYFHRMKNKPSHEIGLAEGTPIELIVEDNHLLIQKAYRLDALLAQITPENLHSEKDTGSAVDREVW